MSLIFVNYECIEIFINVFYELVSGVRRVNEFFELVYSYMCGEIILMLVEGLEYFLIIMDDKIGNKFLVLIEKFGG